MYERNSTNSWKEASSVPVMAGEDSLSEYLLEAIDDQREVEFCYHGGTNSGSCRTVLPQELFKKVGYGGCYLKAYSADNNESRIFRLDKIQLVEQTTRPQRGAPRQPADDSTPATSTSSNLADQILGAIKTMPGQKSVLRRTPLAKLCRYYLDCLEHDGLGGVSVFAESKNGNPAYVELSELPIINDSPSDPFGTASAQQLLAKTRRDPSRQTLSIGYPVRLRYHQSAKGWEGYFLEPIFLLPLEEPENGNGRPWIGDALLQINFKALSHLCNSSSAGLMEEAILLAEELGLNNAEEDLSDPAELFTRLREIRPEWDWAEEIDPYAMESEIPVSEIRQQGIYNRCVLVATEQSKYTKGLETALGKLKTLGESDYCNTSLGAWLNNKAIDILPAEPEPLIEVLPLNTEQRQAVKNSLTNPLTVVTGPPGTGKSQVVTSILINAAWQGKTVLFASKNNKAVDVVESRVNGMGSRPVLLRQGSNQYQSRLAEYMVSVLSMTATEQDKEQYRKGKEIHSRLQDTAKNLDAQARKTVALRNDVDKLEQTVESIRSRFGQEAFHRIRTIADRELERAGGFQQVILQADKDRQPFLTRLFWPFIRSGRFENLERRANAFSAIGARIGLPVPEALPVEGWLRYCHQLTGRLSEIKQVKKYFHALAELMAEPSLEEVSKERSKLTKQISRNSRSLWESWLRLQPTRMTPEDRKHIGDFGALLQMIVAANENGTSLNRDVWGRFYHLFPKITSILSCWAITSLSAGKVPLEPAFFDLLVIDEASQCDIASALPLLYRAKRVVVIGDPMQLRHISKLPTQKDVQLLAQHQLVDDYSGWSYSIKSLYDLASSLCRGEDIVTLRDHFRSHADIIGFSNEEFYSRSLRVATPYSVLNSPWNEGPAVRWVDIRGQVTRPQSGGSLNEVEAVAVINELEKLIEGGYRGSIGVISPFRAQANRIRELVSQHDSLGSRLADVDFLADTVHKFQGDERDVMFFSPVVAAGMGKGSLNFLKKSPNLFNVAISRARAGLIVVGDKSSSIHCGVDYLSRFAAYTENPGCKKPKYPAVADTERVSEWERYFYKALSQSGISTIPQYQVEKYILDFALVQGDRRLNIELDGMHHKNWDGELCRQDQMRNERLVELGWDVMRFWIYQVRDDLGGCIDRVNGWIQSNRNSGDAPLN